MHENILLMATGSEEIRNWVREELKALRLQCMETHKIPSVEKFAERVKISKEHVYKLERGHSSPTVETLHQWLTACDTTLGEFFAKLLSRAELSKAHRETEAERLLIQKLTAGLSNKTTKRIVEDAAAHVAQFLELLNAQ